MFGITVKNFFRLEKRFYKNQLLALWRKSGNVANLLLLCFFFLTPTSSYAAVAIDVGHYTKRGMGGMGCTSASGIPESLFNLQVSKEIKEELERRNVSVFLIQNTTLRERVEIANTWANIFISIHHDSVSKTLQKVSHKFSGFSIFVSYLNPYFKESFELAKEIASNLISNSFKPALFHEGNKRRKYVFLDRERGIYRGDCLLVVRETSIPAVLLECGVISNSYEEAFLQVPENRRKLVMSVCDAIQKFIERFGSSFPERTLQKPEFVQEMQKVEKLDLEKEKKDLKSKNTSKKRVKRNKTKKEVVI